MTIADDVKTVLDNQAKQAATQAQIVDAVHAVATKIDGIPAGQTVDLKPELDLLATIKADLEPTPTPAPQPEPAPAPAPEPAPASSGSGTGNAA